MSQKVENETLRSIAASLVKPITLSQTDLSAATVGCALLAKNGKIYEGICIHLACGIGFCAEASAIANMIKDGETEIVKIVATSTQGTLSPCGRCREMMIQVNKANLDTFVIMPHEKEVYLKELIPNHWMSD